MVRVDPKTLWHSRYGGIPWRVAPAGIETRADGLMRTRGEPITMRRLLAVWVEELKAVARATGTPLPILMMTVATEGALRWTGERFEYPPLRKEPGYTSDAETPHRISFGPMHVLLSTYRAAMDDPGATRRDAMNLVSNLFAGARYMADQESVHGWDPILVAAAYNAGGLYDASATDSRYHNRWHLRTYGSHLDRAARWYGDACAVLAEAVPPVIDVEPPAAKVPEFREDATPPSLPHVPRPRPALGLYTNKGDNMTTMVQAKPWWASKLVWLGVAQIVAGVGEVVATTPVLQGSEIAGWASTITGALTIVLRLVTNKPVATSSKPVEVEA